MTTVNVRKGMQVQVRVQQSGHVVWCNVIEDADLEGWYMVQSAPGQLQFYGLVTHDQIEQVYVPQDFVGSVSI